MKNGILWIKAPASYTIEAAGVMAVVLFTMMVLLNQAFHVHAETTGCFIVHETVERERHKIEIRMNRRLPARLRVCGGVWN